jgi:hypothetical protein
MRYLDKYIAIAHDPAMREFRDKEIQKNYNPLHRMISKV